MKARRRDAPEAASPDKPTAGAHPTALGDAVAAVVSRRGWQARLEGARIHERWAEIAGERLAEHTEPVRLRAGVLVLRADSAAWATQVHYLGGELAARANTVLGEGQVRKVTITTGPLKGTAA